MYLLCCGFFIFIFLVMVSCCFINYRYLFVWWGKMMCNYYAFSQSSVIISSPIRLNWKQRRQRWRAHWSTISSNKSMRSRWLQNETSSLAVFAWHYADEQCIQLLKTSSKFIHLQTKTTFLLFYLHCNVALCWTASSVVFKASATTSLRGLSGHSSAL